jgi:hypothetical protein
MSRGLGNRQRHILETLTRLADRQGADRWWRTCVFDDRALDHPCVWESQTRAEMESTRRALRRLETLGLIDLKLEPRRSSGIPGMPPLPAELVSRLSVVPGTCKDNTYPAPTEPSSTLGTAGVRR